MQRTRVRTGTEVFLISPPGASVDRAMIFGREVWPGRVRLAKNPLLPRISNSRSRAMKASVDAEVAMYLDVLIGCERGDIDRVLLLGEGDFSFSKVLVQYYRSKTRNSPVEFQPSTKESRRAVEENYSGAKANLQALEDSGCRVAFDVDGTEELLAYGGRTFDRIIFNFPCSQHVTAPHTQKDDRMLLNRLLSSTREALSARGQFWLTLCNIQCDQWGLIEAASENNLEIVDTLPFPLKALREMGYSRVRGSGQDSDFKTRRNTTYVLERR